jgi:hypothetical protein
LVNHIPKTNIGIEIIRVRKFRIPIKLLLNFMVIDGEMKVSKAENLKKKKTIYG